MNKIGRAVKTSSNARKYRLQLSQVLQKYGLSYPQLECLYEISKAINNPGQLSSKLFQERASVSRVVRDLDAKNLIRYIRDKEDRRKVYLEISPKGKILLDAIEAAI